MSIYDRGATDGSGGNFGGNLLLTQTAWMAGHKALNFLPKSWQDKIAGRQDHETIYDFILNTMDNNIVEMLEENAPIIDKTGQPANVTIEKYLGDGNQNYYYTTANQNFYGQGGYVCMYLRVQGLDTMLEIPCVDGSPKISMQVIQNEMPTASNQVATTNRRVKPIVFKFSFPIAYLRIYETRPEESEIKDTRGKVKKFIDNTKDGAKNIWNKAVSWVPWDNTLAYDKEYEKEGQLKERTIPSYSQVFKQLVQFPRQFGCWLYMGFGYSKIGVTCSIEMSSGKGDMDCIWVDMTLVETMEFDFNQLRYDGVDDFMNNQSISSQSQSTGSTQPNANEVSA